MEPAWRVLVEFKQVSPQPIICVSREVTKGNTSLLKNKVIRKTLYAPSITTQSYKSGYLFGFLENKKEKEISQTEGMESIR